MPDPFWTPEDLAARWQRPADWIRRQAKSGEIPAVRIGGRWRFDPDDITAYEARHRTSVDPLTLTPLAARRLMNRTAR